MGHQLCKIINNSIEYNRQSGGLLGRLLGSLLKTGLPFIGNVLKSLAKSILIPLGLTAAASATDAAIHKKMFGSDTRPSDLALRMLYERKVFNYVIRLFRC